MFRLIILIDFIVIAALKNQTTHGSKNLTFLERFTEQEDAKIHHQPARRTTESETWIICEDAKRSIRCPEDSFIIIVNAFYGRKTNADHCGLTSSEVCGDERTETTSKYLIKNRCDSKRSCELTASNSVFGDPCPGIKKYIEVEFKCRANCIENEELQQCLPGDLDDIDFEKYVIQPSHFVYTGEENKYEFVSDLKVTNFMEFKAGAIYEKSVTPGNTVEMLCTSSCIKNILDKDSKKIRDPIVKCSFGKYYRNFEILFMLVGGIFPRDVFEKIDVTEPPYLLSFSSFIDDPPNLGILMFDFKIVMDEKDSITMMLYRFGNRWENMFVYCSTMEASKETPKYKCAAFSKFPVCTMKSGLQSAQGDDGKYMMIDDLERKLPFLIDKTCSSIDVMFQHSYHTIEKLDFIVLKHAYEDYFVGKKKPTEGTELIQMKDYVEGGSDVFTIRYVTNKDQVKDYLNYEDEEKVIFRCRFFFNKIEVTFIPPMQIEASNIQKILGTDKVIPIAETYDVNMITLHRENDKLCFHLKINEEEDLHGGMVSITNTTFIYCQDSSNQETVECKYNDERAFEAKAQEVCLKQECDDGNCPFVIHGKLEMFDFGTLRLIADDSFTGELETSNPNIFNFPVEKLAFSLYTDRSYSRIDGEADFHGKPFGLQVVFKTNQHLGLCLEYKKITTNKDQQEIDNGPLTILDVANLLTAPTAKINTISKLAFDEIKLGFQDWSFYNDADLATDLNIKCRHTREERDEFSSRVNREWTASTTYLQATLTKDCSTLCDTLKSVCEFFNSRRQTNHYKGFFDGKNLQMASLIYTPEKIELFSGFSLIGCDEPTSSQDDCYKKHMNHAFGLVFPSGTDTKSVSNPFDEIFGYVTSTTYPHFSRVEAYISFNNGIGYLKFSKKEVDNPNFLGAPNVEATNIYSESHEINLENFGHIELHCDIEIGTTRPIRFPARPEEGKDLQTSQFLYSNKDNNKFWSCTNTDGSMSQLIEVAGITQAADFLLSSVTTKSICIVYTKEENWEIEEKGISATQGLSFHGKYEMQARNNEGAIETFTLDFMLHATDKKLTIELPPIIQGKQFVIQRSADLNKLGPKLHIDFANLENYGKFTGVIKIFGMEVKRQLKLDNQNSFVAVNTGESAEEENGFAKGFSISGVLAYSGTEPHMRFTSLEITFSGEYLVQQVETEYEKVTLLTIEEVQLKATNVNNIWQNMLEKLDSYKAETDKKSEIKPLVRKMSNIKDTFGGYEMKLLKDCNRECKMSMTPGFKWDKCQLSNKGNVSCLKFKKSVLPSTNMHCLADCEMKQADAYERSTNERGEYQALQKRVLQLSVPADLYNELTSSTNTVKWNAQNHISTMNSVKSDIEGFSGQKSDVTGFTANFDLENHEGSPITEFPIKDLTVNVQKSERTEISNKYLFDENIAARVAKKMFQKDHRFDLPVFEYKVKEAEESIDQLKEIVNRWEKKNRVELERLRRNVISTDKRYFISDMDLQDSASSFYLSMKPDMLAAIEHFSPWNVLKKSYPFEVNNKQTKSQKRDYFRSSLDECTSRENKISMYKDMSLYMKSWIQAYDDGKTTLQEYQKDISKGLKRFSRDIISKRSGQKQTNSTLGRVKEAWYRRLSNGFKTWNKELERQVNNLHSEGASKMMNELNNIFTPNGHQTLQAYFQSSNADVINKRHDDMTSLQQIEQTFADSLSKIKTLSDGREIVQQIDYLVNEAKQTSARCHDEL